MLFHLKPLFQQLDYVELLILTARRFDEMVEKYFEVNMNAVEVG